MTKKKKRRRSRGPREPAAAAAPPELEPKQEEAPPRRRLFERRPRTTEPSPFPSFGVSLARGFRAAGSSPAILAVAFLSMLALWGGYALLEAVPSPRIMTDLLALPPVHINFDVSQVTTAAETTFAASALVFAAMAVRSVLLGLLTLLLLGALRDGAPDLRDAFARLPKVAVALLVVYIAEVGLVLAVPILVQTIGGAQLAVLGGLATLIFGLHFLGLAPVIAAADGDPGPEALRRSIRAARLPGMRHLGLVLAYFFFVFYSSLAAPSELQAPATPTIAIWALVLFTTFVHVGVLGAFAYRWLIVRDRVPATERPPAR